MRYFAEISYRGTAYNGWQIQQNAPKTIQAELNRRLSLLAGEEISCVGCGRTDTGVHAKQFYLHFDVQKELPDWFTYKLDRFLPPDIHVRRIFHVPDELHARFSALSRTYHYFISTEKDPLSLGYCSIITRQFDVKQMQMAANLLLKYEDFESFSKVSADQEHHRCKIHEARWIRRGSKLIFRIKANRFLRGMVRILVGTLLEVGQGKMTLEEFESLLQMPDRRKAGSAAPADGLYLWEVEYGNEVVSG